MDKDSLSIMRLASRAAWVVVMAFAAGDMGTGEVKAQFASSPPMAEKEFIAGNLVIIYGNGGTATGSIVGHKGNKYLVLTTKHAVDVQTGGEIEVETGTRDRYPAKLIKSSDKADLAILSFESKDCLPAAYLGFDSILIGQKMSPQAQPNRKVVAGYSSVDPQISKRALLRVSPASINVVIPKEDAREGYSVGYNAPTARGMSGGAMFTDSHNLEGHTCMGKCNNPYGYHLVVHGRGESDELRSGGKTGYNFGIPSGLGLGLIASAGLVENANLTTLYISASDDIDAKEIMGNQLNGGFKTATTSCSPKGLIPVEIKRTDVVERFKQELRSIKNR